jgi:hypothetical protein
MGRRGRLPRAGLLGAALAVLVTACTGAGDGGAGDGSGGGGERGEGKDPPAASAPANGGTGDAPSTPAGQASVIGRPYSTKVPGMLTFRGNPTRTYYGQGPVPRAPKVLWRFPESGTMCSLSTFNGSLVPWCGTGWTGQPNVWERGGKTWVSFGAFDKAYHFLDAASGERLLPDLETGDINKGSATVDPDGFPLYYAGSRDNEFRIIALDRDRPETLWSMNGRAFNPQLWNDDWDAAPLVLGDYLLQGGENSRFFIVKLNRGYGPDGKVTVRPQIVVNIPGWDRELLGNVGDDEVSIENSVAVRGDTIYFANSGGLVQGYDMSAVRTGGQLRPVFKYWTGDDVDASIVIDDEGFLYVAAEYERATDRSKQVGQLMKLDPRRPANPLVWSLPDRGYFGPNGAAGIWATPAIAGDVLIASTNGGRMIGVDRKSGELLWTVRFVSPQLWASPVVVDNVLIQADCQGNLVGYDVKDPRRQPRELWRVDVGDCIEATPTVWKGRIYVGERSGKFVAVG